MFFKKKEPSSFLTKSHKLLKSCYDRGAIIEYNDNGKWTDLPSGLPLDFSKFEEGVIRLKFNDPTYEQVIQFKQQYENPIVTDWDLKNIPMLAFCYNKGFCSIFSTKVGARLEWNSIVIWRYYDKKEYLQETPISELMKIIEEKV